MSGSEEENNIDNPEVEDEDRENVVYILIATDNHLGFCEKDTIRSNDSFVTFEEILELAVAHDVDFILLGGDLFHDTNPSPNALHKCLKLLRQYTFGDRTISMEFVSDQSLAFEDALHQSVNYEDPNINVSIPVFSIHGNHDDPSGFGGLSSLNLLATVGLINYFGRWTDLNQIDINPILLRKGETQIALYGLSHIHDARLNRLFQMGKVMMHQPDQSSGDWFNIMVVHQNRADRGPKNYLPEDVLPDFLDIVLWGHEHDCRITPEVNEKQKFYVTQPGSSVATSLSEGEAIKKNVGILKVYHKGLKMIPIPLQTVRPFVFESIKLCDYSEEYGLDQADASEKVEMLAKEKMEELITRAKERLTGHPKQPKLPIIRLRLVYNDELQMFNAIRFGQQYMDRIANPSDVILFKKDIKRTKSEGKPFDKHAMNSAFKNEELDDEARVEDVVDRYFTEVEDSKSLQIMTSKIMSEMCYRMVEKNDADAAETIVSEYKKKAIAYLMDKLPSEEGLEEEIQRFLGNGTATYDSILKILHERGASKTVDDEDLDSLLGESSVKPAGKQQANKAAETNGDDVVTPVATTTRGRGRGRGGARGRGRGANASSSGRTMPQLDISVGSKSNTSTKQPTLFDAMNQRSSRNRAGPKVVYDISSDSD